MTLVDEDNNSILAKDVAQSGEIQPILHEYENGRTAVSILRT